MEKKRFSNHPEQWGEFVDVKHWPDIKDSKKYAGKELFIGSVADPYQPLEEKYGCTRALFFSMRGLFRPRKKLQRKHRKSDGESAWTGFTKDCYALMRI